MSVSRLALGVVVAVVAGVAGVATLVVALWAVGEGLRPGRGGREVPVRGRRLRLPDDRVR